MTKQRNYGPLPGTNRMGDQNWTAETVLIIVLIVGLVSRGIIWIVRHV